jgi:hypothetical protein
VPLLTISLEQLADIAQIAGFAGIALLILQIGLGLRNSRVELTTNLTTMMTQIDQVFIEHPGIRKYFEEGKKPNADDVERARAVALTFANTLDHVVAHLRLMKRDARLSWEKYIAHLHEQSPVFADLLDRHGDDWWPYLRRMLREWRISGRLGDCPVRGSAAD